MIVIAIIGILSAISIISYQHFSARGQVSEAISLTSGLKSAVSDAYSAKGACPDNSAGANLGVAQDTDINGKYVEKTTTGGTATTSGGCTISATMKATGVSAAIQSKTVTLTLSGSDKGSMKWACTSTIAAEHLPSVCR